MSASFFLIPGSPEHTQRRRELKERDEAHVNNLQAEARDVENRIAQADQDHEGALILEVARFLDAQAFVMRDDSKAAADKMRRGPKGNDPDFQRAIVIRGTLGNRSVRLALDRAERLVALVRAWG